MIEPCIGYGAFNRDGTEAQPGTDHVRAGYGIVNAPRHFYGMVAETADDPDLQSFLATAKVIWSREVAVEEFRTAEDKWQFFIGQTIDGFEINRSDLSFRVRNTTWFTISYRATSLHCGIMEADDIVSSFRSNPRKLISASTDADLITTLTFEDGLTFSFMPLYFGMTDNPPVWSIPTGAHLIKLKENV